MNISISIQRPPCELPPPYQFLFQLFNRFFDLLLSALDWEDLADFVVVKDVGEGSALGLSQVNQKIHTPIKLRNILQIPRWLEDLTLKRYDGNHNAIQNLKLEIIPHNVVALVHILATSTLLYQSAEAQVICIMEIPYFAEPNNCRLVLIVILSEYG